MQCNQFFRLFHLVCFLNFKFKRSQYTFHENKASRKNGSAPAGLFYSRSDIFPFEKTLNNRVDEKHDDKCNYIVHDPVVLDGDNKNRKNARAIIEKLERKKRKKVRRHYSDASTSPSREKKYQHKRKGNGTKARVVKEHPKDAVVGSGDSDLLQLVRRLSSSDHVKMGANVSRHSSKGLSGRRSQSSGSICNGKGRHGDGKMCGSLPSYLDDRNSTGCNNNHHDCEKPPLDEVQRIPPLGDGAPLHWKFSDNQTALCDQGYGSERSPEEEYPPPLPDHDSQCHHHLEPHACYPFITPESTFIVKLTKSSRGLGLSVTGGIDSGGSWPGLIRIKRLFPHQPASACGLLNVGDLLIEANGITLTGLTNYEALEVLRTAPNQVDLKVCRPPPDVLSCVSPISEVPPPPPRREPPTSLNLHSSEMYCTPEDDYYHGVPETPEQQRKVFTYICCRYTCDPCNEFEVTLTKIQGSLGFTLRKEDDSALGHYVRALVREPALTDGRIRAGDKIIAVNEVEISSMSHEQAVQFLRQCGDVVKLRLYRDSAQTPVAALSPTETTPRTSFSKKTNLRQEAVDMLNDIAVRKLIPSNHPTYKCTQSPTSSPRRLRRQACPSDASQMTDVSMKYLINEEQFHEGLLQKCSLPYDDDINLFTIDPDDGDRPSRPSSLDLYNPNQTPVACRKPRFNFSLAHNAYELNNLDADVLDAPNLTYNLGNDDVKSTEVECGDSFPKEPASMPHIPSDNPGFSYKNPAYQSAHPPCGTELEEKPAPPVAKSGKPDDSNMKKWKGVVFEGHDEKEEVPKMTIEEEYEILAIELNRGWNSRLGFSLQGAAGVTYVSAVHADSVAARDGRLKPGDRVIKVNDESVEHLSTNEIIDLLRIVRGPVCIVVSRIKSKEDCPKSNAEN
ncbi:tyrosine-protein phosphatase non-receptor type 13-like isoform X3 [Zophobas morio]|uniref:tyrosine-protein phosphatase non-receptor type 13-like isoform X3 n=1 Tax=Zophobas morio TaxID=2755281 RepID=UPI003083BC02